MRKKKRTFTCKPGDVVYSSGQKVQVAQVVEKGRESYVRKTMALKKKIHCKGTRSLITVCTIRGNGQVMSRNPRFIGDDWKHWSITP